MAIKFAEVQSPKSVLDKAKKVRQQAQAIEAALTEIAVKRGRGRPVSGKETVTLRLDSRTVAFFKGKSYGKDWRLTMADALDKAAHVNTRT